jgi:beta-lactamase class A
MRVSLILFLLTLAPTIRADAQEVLRREIGSIASEARGAVSVACSLPGSSLNCDLDAHAHPPMQSVFKLPLALTVLHEVEQGRMSLDQPIRFKPEDRILPKVYSPLQAKYPAAGVDVPLRDLLEAAVSVSDNVAADILLRIGGGTKAVSEYMVSLGVVGFQLQDGEKALHGKVALQYRNWFEPVGAVQLLRRISDSSPLTVEHTKLLLGWMQEPVRSDRLGAELPATVRVAHKSGTSDVDDGVAHATNDIGLIWLPDGRQMAIAVFVTDSVADMSTRQKVIARIAKVAYETALTSR